MLSTPGSLSSQVTTLQQLWWSGGEDRVVPAEGRPWLASCGGRVTVEDALEGEGGLGG